MNKREVLTSYEELLKANLMTLQKLNELSGRAGDSHMNGFTLLLGAQIKMILESVQATLASPDEDESEPAEEDSYDLLKLWRFMEGNDGV